MVKFRQLIRPGQRGRDVRAVKRAMLRMGVKGSGALGKTNKAGPQFVKCLKRVQNQHNERADGIYGKHTHKIIAPHFDAYGRFLYRTARKRTVKRPKRLGTAQEVAKEILASGKWHADNSGDLRDMQATAEGRAVWSPAGHYVHIDKRPLEAILFLIHKGFHIGTFAICSDHHYDGPHGHSGGLAVDISSINGVAVGSHAARENTLKVARILRNEMPSGLHPWQEICDGYGYIHDSEIAACTIPGSWFYGYTTMSQHRNHIHLGYYT